MLDANETQDLIARECNNLRDMLIDKNQRYGNSALQPMRVFSKADAMEQINVRIDDKLNRIINQRDGDDDEDAEMDLIGYLILKRVARTLHSLDDGYRLNIEGIL